MKVKSKAAKKPVKQYTVNISSWAFGGIDILVDAATGRKLMALYRVGKFSAPCVGVIAK